MTRFFPLSHKQRSLFLTAIAVATVLAFSCPGYLCPHNSRAMQRGPGNPAHGMSCFTGVETKLREPKLL